MLTNLFDLIQIGVKHVKITTTILLTRADKKSTSLTSLIAEEVIMLKIIIIYTVLII